MTTTRPRRRSVRRGGGRRRPRDLRDHRRPGPGDDVPVAVPARGRGLLDCPIVGVAVDDWSLERLVERARDSIVATGEELDEDVSRGSPRGSPTCRVTSPTPPPTSGWGRRSGPPHPVFYLEIPPFLFGTVVKGLAEAGLTARPGSWSRSRSVTTWIRPGAGRGLHQYVDEAQIYRIDHYLGKMGSRRSSTCGSPTRSSSRCGTATTSIACRSRWPRTSVSRIAGTLRPGRRTARRRGQPPHAGGRGRRDGGTVGPGPRGLRDAQVALFRSVKDADPAHYVRGQHDGYRRCEVLPPTRPPRRTSRCGWTSTTGAGRGARSSSVPGSCSRPPRPSSGSSSGSRRRFGSGSGRRRPQPARNSSSSSSTPRPAPG